MFIELFAEIYHVYAVRMEMDLNYYYGNCTTLEAQSKVKHNFIQLLNGTFFKEVCHSKFKDRCKAYNVEVSCSGVGLVPCKRKSSEGMA